jgi:hypothetical protein
MLKWRNLHRCKKEKRDVFTGGHVELHHGWRAAASAVSADAVSAAASTPSAAALSVGVRENAKHPAVGPCEVKRAKLGEGHRAVAVAVGFSKEGVHGGRVVREPELAERQPWGGGGGGGG